MDTWNFFLFCSFSWRAWEGSEGKERRGNKRESKNRMFPLTVAADDDEDDDSWTDAGGEKRGWEAVCVVCVVCVVCKSIAEKRRVIRSTTQQWWDEWCVWATASKQWVHQTGKGLLLWLDSCWTTWCTWITIRWSPSHTCVWRSISSAAICAVRWWRCTV